MTAASSRTAQTPIVITTPSARRQEGRSPRPTPTPRHPRPSAHLPTTTSQPLTSPQPPPPSTLGVTTSPRRPQMTSARHLEPPPMITTARPPYWTPKPPASPKPQRPPINTTLPKVQDEKLRLGEKLDNAGEGNQVHKKPRGRSRGHGLKRGRWGRRIRAGTVRLVSADGLSDRGRVEIFIRGEWGTVCDDLFTSRAATVVCRQLGFTAALAVMKRAALGEADGGVRIQLDDVECEGAERSLLECKRSSVGKHNCSHAEDVGVICGHRTGEE